MIQTIYIIFMIIFVVIVGTATIVDSFAMCKIKKKIIIDNFKIDTILKNSTTIKNQIIISEDEFKIDTILKNSTSIKNQIIISEDESIKLCKRYYKLYTKFEKFLLTRKYLILNIENLLNSTNNSDKKIIFDIDKKKLVKKIKKNDNN